MATTKAEETGQRILDAALELFRRDGFESATMRDIARKADVATGAAYYYYPSKDAIVLDFYRRAADAMQPDLTAAASSGSLEKRLCEIIRVKLLHFDPNRQVLRALLRNGADPRHPLSPFSAETREIRTADIAWFERILTDSGTRIPRDLAPHLPGVLWFYQMGVIFFWVTDESPDQARTDRLLRLSCKLVVSLVRAAALPFFRPLRKAAVQLIEVVRGESV